MKDIRAYASIKSGKLRIAYRNLFEEAIGTMPDCQGELLFRKLYKRRSTKTENGSGQNGYYFGVVVQEYRRGAWEMQQRLLTTDQAHEELKANCAYEERYNEDTGVIMRTIKHTSEMNTVEFEEFLEKSRQFICEWFGIVVYLPNEQTELEIKP